MSLYYEKSTVASHPIKRYIWSGTIENLDIIYYCAIERTFELILVID